MGRKDELEIRGEDRPAPHARSVAHQLREAHGLARVLAVGVAAYRTSSGFHPLKTCANDALAVRDRFRDIEQLNADQNYCLACTSKNENPPTRGEILRLLHELAEGAFTIDVKEANDEVTLWSQYHALKALATRLDAGCGTERDRVMFEVILREYNAYYDRVRAGGRQVLGVGIPETEF